MNHFPVLQPRNLHALCASQARACVPFLRRWPARDPGAMQRQASTFLTLHIAPGTIFLSRSPIKKSVNTWYIHQHLPATVFESHAVASFLCCWCMSIITCLLASLTWKIAEQLEPDATASNRVLSSYLFFTISMEPLFQDIFWKACLYKKYLEAIHVSHASQHPCKAKNI